MKMYTKAGSVEFMWAANACPDGWLRHSTCHMNTVHQTMLDIYTNLGGLVATPPPCLGLAKEKVRLTTQQLQCLCRFRYA